MSNSPNVLISRLRVHNFRSLADVDLTLEPLTVFVGPNGAGKSNIIDVLRFVRDALTHGLDNAIMDRQGMSALRRWSAKGRPFDVHILLNLTSNDWEAEYGFILGSELRGEYRVKWEKCSVKEKKKNSKPTSYEVRDSKWVQTPSEEERAGRLLTPSPTALMLPRSFMGTFFRIQRALQDMGFYIIYPNSLREPQKPSNPRPLDEKGLNLATVLREMKKRKSPATESLLEALGKVSEGIRDVSVSQVGGYLVTRLHHEKGGPAFELAQESDGTLRMLGLLTALYQIPPRSLLGIEEPELTIHPGALGVLCDVLQEASSRNQVLITTHSPDLIYHFPAQTLRVVEKVNGVTAVGPVADHQRQAIEAKLFAPGELMRIEGLQRQTN